MIKRVLRFNGIENWFVFAVTYCSCLSAHSRLKGYTSQKSIDFFLNSSCIKCVTFYLSVCNFAIMYLYKEIKFKPNRRKNPAMYKGLNDYCCHLSFYSTVTSTMREGKYPQTNNARHIKAITQPK